MLRAALSTLVARYEEHALGGEGRLVMIKLGPTYWTSPSATRTIFVPEVPKSSTVSELNKCRLSIN